MPCRPKHGSKCESCHTAHRDEILSTARPSCLYRAGTTQNISCRAVLWVVPNDRATARPKIARPKSQFFSLFSLFPLLFSLSPLSLGYHSCGGPGVGLWFVLWRFVFWTSRRTTDKLVYTALRFHRAKQPPAESPFTPSPICSLLINKLIWSQRWLLVKQEEPVLLLDA